MEGIFVRKKTNIWLALLLLCGILFVVLYAFLNMVDSEAAGELLVFLILGILFGLIAIPSMLLNRGAYIRVGENTVKAKYHWFGRLDCGIGDIEFVLPQINTLTILLKSGKRHVIMGVENAWALGTELRKRCYAVEKENPDSLGQKLSIAQAGRRKELRRVLAIGALLFVNIFITVLLTGGRELHEFSSLDWVLFSAMGVVELLTLLFLFWAAQRCGKGLLPIEELKYRLRGAVIATCPLPTNHTAAVYADANNWGRVVVCGFPDDDSVYYCVQEMNGSFALETVHTSEIFDSLETLPEAEFSELIDITICL